MRVGILTQPLHTNYGGIIQAYALKTILEQEGYEVWFIDRYFKPITKRRKICSLIKRFLLKNLLGQDIIIRIWPNEKEKAVISRNMNEFVKKNFQMTETIYKTKDFSCMEKYGFKVYIAGSDQVWRPKYSPCITNYFFDFLNKNSNVRKIAYAASFGVDGWEFSSQQTKSCASLAKQFDAISVREDSAVHLCKDYFDVEATFVLDPTMLLKKEDYLNLIKQKHVSKRENSLFTYVLDESTEEKNMIQKIAEELNLQPVSIMPVNSFHEKILKEDLSDCVYSTVENWIAGFRDAKFVITDSFHGAVFAILFNKPFVVFPNKERGNARLDSLLRLFQLENRLIATDEITAHSCELDYSEVNETLTREREKSLRFLKNALNI